MRKALRTAAIWLLLPPLILLSISFGWVLLTPEPRDPWRTTPLPADGELVAAADGTDLFVRRWLPTGSPTAVVLGLHGLGQHSGYHRTAGEHLAAEGTAYYALDVRGNGLTRSKHGDVPSIDVLYDDLDLLVRTLQARHPGAKLFVLGHSMGGAMIATWAAERHPDIAGLLVLAPAITAEAAPVPWANWVKGPALWMLLPHRVALGLDPSAYARDRLAGSVDDPAQLDWVTQDPLHLQGMSMAFALAAQQFREEALPLAGDIQLPTLVLVGEDDPARTGAQRFHDALSAGDRELVTVPDATHMLFQIKATPVVMEHVVRWLRAHG